MMISEFNEAIRVIQNSGPNIKLKSITVDKKTRDQLIFEMMKQARDISNPTMQSARSYGGIVTLMGVEIIDG